MPRPTAPWYRHATGRWYVTILGKQTALPVTDPSDEGAAWEAVRALIGKALQQPVVRTGTASASVPDYISSLAHKTNARTRRGYGYMLNQFCARFGNSAIDQIKPEIVEVHASEQDWSDTYRANYLWVVQAFVRWCGRKDFSLHRPQRESRGAEAIISPETQRLILRETRGDFHELCRFLWATGCRPMEAAKIQYGDVNWSSGTVTLKQHKTRHKGKKRTIYLSGEAIAILRGQAERCGNEGHLFRGIGNKPFSLQAVVSRMWRISERIGRTVTAYGYRHSYATRALEAGTPDTHVAALLGHVSTKMLHEHYSHVVENARLLREVAEKIGQENHQKA